MSDKLWQDKLQINMHQLDNRLKVLTVSGKVEKMIADNIQQTEQGNYLSIDPQHSQEILGVDCRGSGTSRTDGSIASRSLFASNSDVFKTNN